MTIAQPPPHPSPAVACEMVRSLNAQSVAAARTGDADWFRGRLAEDAVVVLGSGRRLTKPEFLALVEREPPGFRSLSVRDVTVRVFGPVVQVDADAPWVRSDGQRGVSRYLDTWAWLDGRWQVISAQITLLPANDVN